MKSRRILGATSMACGVALAFAGTALADTATVGDTGPGSMQNVQIDNSVQVSSTNINTTSVTNESAQQANTGNTVAADNTSVNGAGSGAAGNNNGTATVVTNNNAPAGQGMSVTPTAPSGGAGAAGSSTTGSGNKQPTSGSVLGAATVAASVMLPEVGATVPVDVSALRAAWHAPSAAPTTDLVRSTSGFTAGMLGVATALSLLGGVCSVLYGRRKTRRV